MPHAIQLPGVEHFAKPEGNLPIDWSNPITHKLVAWVDQRSGVNLISNNAGSTITGALRQPALLKTTSALTRGYGTTHGTGTTDILTSGAVAASNQRSYFWWGLRNGYGGSGVGRMFSIADVEYAYQQAFSGTEVFYVRAWATQAGAWYITGPSASVWTSFGVTYDGNSDANDPVMYMDGQSKTVTELLTPTGTITGSFGAISMGNRASDSARNYDGMLGDLLLWNRILSADEFRYLHENMWRLLEPQRITMYWPSAGLSIPIAAYHYNHHLGSMAS